jgi:hypothetical protein
MENLVTLNLIAQVSPINGLPVFIRFISEILPFFSSCSLRDLTIGPSTFADLHASIALLAVTDRRKSFPQLENLSITATVFDRPSCDLAIATLDQLLEMLKSRIQLVESSSSIPLRRFRLSGVVHSIEWPFEPEFDWAVLERAPMQIQALKEFGDGGLDLGGEDMNLLLGKDMKNLLEEEHTGI